MNEQHADQAAERSGDQPEPQADPEPEHGPGGPDAFDPDPEAERDPEVADQPLSAQVEEDKVPDEIEQTDDYDDAEDEEPGSEQPS